MKVTYWILGGIAAVSVWLIVVFPLLAMAFSWFVWAIAVSMEAVLTTLHPYFPPSPFGPVE